MAAVKLFILIVVVAIGLPVAASANPPGTAAVQPGTPVQTPLQPMTQAVPGITGQPAGAGPTDIHDIRQPVQVGVNPAIYYGAVGVVAALIIGALAWMLIRRRMKRGGGNAAEVTATIYRSPEEEAFANLAALENNMSDQPAVFYFGLSAIFRRYLQRRFDVDAPEMTTEELLPRLAALNFDRETQAGLKTFLKDGDQVKFARVMPDPADMRAHLTLVRELVNRFAAAEATAGPGGES